MTTPMTRPEAVPRRRGRSATAVILGFVAVVVLSLVTDQLLHVLNVYPPWGEPMYDAGLNLLALGYRCVYTVIGCYIAARLAPRDPMRHALTLGMIGVFAATAGAIASITAADLGPNWYPISLVVTAMPCAWLGGVLHRAVHGARGA